VGGLPTVNQHDRLLFRKRGGSFPRRVALGLLALGKSSRGHVVLHHGAFLQLVPDKVCMIGAGCLQKLLKVIGGQSCLSLDLALGGGNELLVGVTNIFVLVTLVASGGDHDSLGSPQWPPLVASGAPFYALVGCLGWCSPTAVGGCLPATLDKNSPDCLLARGIPGGDVEKLLRGLWLVTTELVHQGSAVCAEPER
jgi:hypothetical protein